MKARPIRVQGLLAYVPLTKGYEAVIDAADIALAEGKNWRASVRKHAVYAVRKEIVDGKAVVVSLHRLLMAAPSHLMVDHISCDGLDNRRANLRVATATQNQRNARKRRDNSSGFKGVHWHKQACKWQSSIRANGVRKSLGLFDTAERAALAYEQASAVLHGDFGRVA